MYAPMVLTQDTSQQHVAGINSQYPYMVCATKFLLHILECISVFVHDACCCEMLILTVPLLYAFSSIVTSYICYSMSQPAKAAR